MLSDNIKNKLEDYLTARCNSKTEIKNISPVGGGCINDVYVLATDKGKFFVKINNAGKYPGMFSAEAKGLQLLASSKTFYVPQVIATGEAEDESFLLLEFIESGRRNKNFFEDFGKKLARLHSFSNTHFGLEYDNYIGSLKQYNNITSDGTFFFINQRLLPQLEPAIKNHKTDSKILNDFEKLFLKFDDLLPHEKPSLLHGDLWSGNYMTASDGSACLIDPAVYYSNREADIAMTKLFGGFDFDFYESYNETFPLVQGWQQRTDIWNLYPLLVHVNLFGGGYLAQVKSVLKKYS